MSKRIKALSSWVLALTFLCLIATGFTLMFHAELLGLRGYPLKVVHTNLAILCVVAGIGHLYFNLETLCKYVWLPKKGFNMFGTFLVAMAMTVAVVGFSATTENRCGENGPRHRGGAGYGRGQGQGQQRHRYQDEDEHHDEHVEEHAQAEVRGLGRGQGGPGRGLGPGQGKGLGRGRGQGRGQGYGRGPGYGRGGGGTSDTNELPTEPSETNGQ